MRRVIKATQQNVLGDSASRGSQCLQRTSRHQVTRDEQPVDVRACTQDPLRRTHGTLARVVGMFDQTRIMPLAYHVEEPREAFTPS